MGFDPQRRKSPLPMYGESAVAQSHLKLQRIRQKASKAAIKKSRENILPFAEMLLITALFPFTMNCSDTYRKGILGENKDYRGLKIT